MPGMPIFQDSPSQLKGQIYVQDSTTSNLVPLEVDASGNLSTTFAAGSEVSLTTGTTVGLTAGTTLDTVTAVTTITNDVGVVNGATPLNVGTVTAVTAITDDVGVVNGATPLNVGTVTAVTAITDDVGVVNGATPLDIGTVSTITAVTAITDDVGVVNGATPLDIGTVSTITAVTAITDDVGVVNGATPLNVGTVTAVTAITDDVGVINGATPLNVGTVTAVTAITDDVGVVNGATALEVALATGTTVGLEAGTNLIGRVENQLVFTNLDAFGAGTPLTSQAVGAGPATVTATSRNISLESSYNWFIKNEGTGATQDITLVVEISPDGTNWMEDTGTIISVAFGESKMITVTNFLQFARFVITGGTDATTVISSFQAQH